MVIMVIKQTKVSTDLCIENLSVVLDGSQCLWLPATVHGDQWFYGYQWLSVVICGFLWLSVVINGFLWLPETVYGHQWFMVTRDCK